MSDDVIKVAMSVLIFMAFPFGAGFGLAYWLSGREFRSLLKVTERAIDTLETRSTQETPND